MGGRQVVIRGWQIVLGGRQVVGELASGLLPSLRRRRDRDEEGRLLGGGQGFHLGATLGRLVGNGKALRQEKTG